jgi:hypothetical protein
MNSQVARDSLELSSRVQFHFALGKSAEDECDHALSFKHYDSGNTLHRSDLNYQSQQNTARAERMKSRFTADFFRDREGMGCTESGPIFIVGMPRAGSTLLEQILASHSMVEGTTELPDIITLAKELRSRAYGRRGRSLRWCIGAHDAHRVRGARPPVSGTHPHTQKDR